MTTGSAHTSVLGVGIAGCGAITQACHIPALASLPALFRVMHCNDIDERVAARVATRLAGARSSSSLDDLLNDSDVDVVAVCVPDRLHADVVVAACEAGKKAVLCEKPLASTLEDADRIVAASAASRVPVIVATMHRYDPVVRRLEQRWGDLPARASLVRSTAYLPPNSRLIDLATETVKPEPSVRESRTVARRDPDALRAALPGFWASGVFVHHMPLLRLSFTGAPDDVAATAVGISGTQIGLRWGTRLAQLSGIAYTFGGLDWSFELWSSDMHVRIDFPVSFLAGHSAVGRIWTSSSDGPEEVRLEGSHETGYRAEWRHLAQVVAGEQEPLTPASGGREDVALAQLIARAGESSVAR